ncbi:MAG: hypothetical protein WAX89_06005, partial [Alphaproteobacteria bacterium]
MVPLYPSLFRQLRQGVGKGAFVLLTFSFLGCATHTVPDVMLLSQASTAYRRTVDVVANDTLLQTSTQQALAKQEALFPSVKIGDGEFRLTLTPTLQPRPAPTQVVGFLDEVTIVERYNIAYTLSLSTGRVLTSGDVPVALPPVTVIAPATLPPQALTAQALLPALQTVAVHLVPFVEIQPWQARITAVLDEFHLTISAPQGVGLEVGHMLRTTTT